MSKKSICLIGAGLRCGGQERALSNIANYASRNGYDVTILSLFRTDVFYELHESIKIIWPAVDRNQMNRYLYAVKLIPYIRSNIIKLKPDTVLSFGEWFNSYVILATRFINIRLYVSDRMGPNLNLGRLHETMRKILYSYADGIIAQTNTAADIIFKKTKSKNIKVIPNIVIPIEVNTSKKKKQIVTVGRLSPEKGHIILIRAFSRINDKDWSLHIVGKGDQLELLLKEVEILGIKDRVIFYGHLNDFSDILGESQIFVLPSLYEGFPNALVEAMTVPLACISSNCVAGPSDIITNNINGILVETANEIKLTEAIDKLIADNDLRSYLSKQAYLIRAKYRYEIIANAYIKFILNFG